MAELPTFRPPGAPGPDVEPVDANGYRAAIADCLALAVAQDLIPPSWQIGERLTVLDHDGRLDLVDPITRDDHATDWRMLLPLQPAVGQAVLWLRVMRGWESRLQRGEGLLSALRALVAAVPEPEPKPKPKPKPEHVCTTLCCLKKGGTRDLYDEPPADLSQVPYEHLNYHGRRKLARQRHSAEVQQL